MNAQELSMLLAAYTDVARVAGNYAKEAPKRGDKNSENIHQLAQILIANYLQFANISVYNIINNKPVNEEQSGNEGNTSSESTGLITE